MSSRPRFAPPPVIYVDVDGTLLIDDAINRPLVDWCRQQHAAGYQLVLWSSAGAVHARQAADRAGLTALFSAILSKPGYLVDDLGWQWVRYTKALPVSGGVQLPSIS